jgi:hypothetical protein
MGSTSRDLSLFVIVLLLVCIFRFQRRDLRKRGKSKWQKAFTHIKGKAVPVLN